MTTAREEIGDRLAAGEALSGEDIRRLTETADLISLGMLADEARRRRHGNRTTFVRVADVPVAGPLPGPSADAGRAQLVEARAAGEIRLVGVPADLDAAAARVRAVAAKAGSVPVSGFLLSDLLALAAAAGRPLGDVLAMLRDAGLALVAEAPLDLLAAPGEALETAAAAGLPVARLTVHRPDTDPVVICRRAADLQRGGDRPVAPATAALPVLAPLPRRPDPSQPSTGYDDVKRVALARLLVGTVASIQVDWALYGPKLAQVALTFGADDLDGVSAIDPPGLGGRRAVLEEIRRNIRAASLEPVERDGRFRIRQAS
jgi:aminodeoxyfutalosine synthase